MSRTPSNAQIEARAYEMYLERGGEDGRDLEDWLAAEKELCQRRQEIEAIYDQEKETPVRLGHAAAAGAKRK
jgi:hypothetical protein